MGQLGKCRLDHHEIDTKYMSNLSVILNSLEPDLLKEAV